MLIQLLAKRIRSGEYKAIKLSNLFIDPDKHCFFAKKPYSLVIFQGGGPSAPLPS